MRRETYSIGAEIPTSAMKRGRHPNGTRNQALHALVEGSAVLDLLIISAASVNGTTASGVDISVKVNDVPATLNFSAVELPPAPRPLKVEVTLTPQASHLFSVTGSFAYPGEGRFLPLDGGGPPNFRPTRAVSIEDGGVVMSLIGYVSRLRDVTARVELIEIGRADARARADEIHAFFS
jgi:hypothetical protein